MLNRLIPLFTGAVMLVLAGVAAAQDDAVRKSFTAKFPQVTIQSVTRFPS